MQSETPHEAGANAGSSVNQHSTFEELTLPLLDSLYNFARWIARNPHDAEDLVQETYLKAFRTFHSLQSPSNVRSWMFKILQNTHLNRCSKLERRMTVQVDEDVDLAELSVNHDTPDTLLSRSIDRDLVRGLITQLPDPFRAVLLLADVEEMSYQEIAGTLEIPIGTVMSRLSRARKLLRQWMAAIATANPEQNQSAARKRL